MDNMNFLNKILSKNMQEETALALYMSFRSPKEKIMNININILITKWNLQGNKLKIVI